MTGEHYPPGTRVILVGSHPEAGNTGTITRWVADATFGPIPQILLDRGIGLTCFATAPNEFGVLPKPKVGRKAMARRVAAAVLTGALVRPREGVIERRSAWSLGRLP